MNGSPPSWRMIQRENFTHWKDLAHFLEWDLAQQPCAVPRFPLNLPRRLASKINKKNPCDPILLQFLPSSKESASTSHCSNDPVGDLPSRKTSKLLYKYEGRALLLCTSACAMHCRYCFRQHYPYETEIKNYDEELDWIWQNPQITEILLSGGDPLSLGNEALGALVQALDAIPHLQRLRFHSRFPMGIPERIDEGFLHLLASSRLQIFFAIHSNHPREWDPEIRASLRKIRRLGIPILCQTVLLKGVNDDVATLKALCEELINQGIIPYYLHQLDPVTGGLHFEVAPEKGLALMSELAKCLPGYALPRYVQEIEGKPHKILITSGRGS